MAIFKPLGTHDHITLSFGRPNFVTNKLYYYGNLNEKNKIIIINLTAISFNVELYIWSQSIVNRVPIHPESHKEKDTMWLLPMAR